MTEIEPLYRMTLWDLEELIELHDKFPLKTIEEILKQLGKEGDYSEYGT